jgi:hypothetical protein
VLSRGELNPCATAALSDVDAALKEHLSGSFTPMRRSNDQSSNTKELRAIREVRRHLRAQHCHHPVLPIDDENMRIPVSERLPQPTLCFQRRCRVSQFSEQGGYGSSVFLARGARRCFIGRRLRHG